MVTPKETVIYNKNSPAFCRESFLNSVKKLLVLSLSRCYNREPTASKHCHEHSSDSNACIRVAVFGKVIAGNIILGGIVHGGIVHGGITFSEIIRDGIVFDDYRVGRRIITENNVDRCSVGNFNALGSSYSSADIICSIL